MNQRHSRLVIILSMAVFTLACAIPALGLSTPAPVPTFDPNSINTVIALTAGSAATQTAQMMPPTLTPTVTLIPADIYTPTGSPTATFLFALASFTPIPTQAPVNSSGEEYDCRVVSQTPEDNSKIVKGLPFEARWRVANIGTRAWDSSSADYRFVSGDKFNLDAGYDLSQTVNPGETTELPAKLQAPTSPGTYTTKWKINIGKTQFCTMKLTIIVDP